jgi:hypothetical protein
MISSQEATKRAKAIPVPVAGEIIDIKPLEVFCKWMEMNHLVKVQWRGSLLVVAPADRVDRIPKQEDR